MTENYRLNLGQFDVLMIKDGGAPRAASGWLASAPQDELKQVVLSHGLDPESLDSSITPIVVNTGSELLLIDTGLGGEKGNLPGRLKENGIDVGDIDAVIVTHGHGDHVGGITDANGELVFPNADYIFWKSEWEYWAGGEPRQGAHPTAWAALKAHPELIVLVGGEGKQEAEIMPGVCAVATPGHTVGHIAVELTSGDGKLLHVADAVHHWFQLDRPEWSPGFDYDPAQSAVTRKNVLERAARDKTLFSAYHFPFPGVGRVHEQSGKFSWEQVGK
jgi:glyoxylase-like metal-dependent hydrolase (beta-lactamase superfamily II)